MRFRGLSERNVVHLPVIGCSLNYFFLYQNKKFCVKLNYLEVILNSIYILSKGHAQVNGGSINDSPPQGSVSGLSVFVIEPGRGEPHAAA